MASPQQIADFAAGLEARGVVPHRPIGPPDWQAKGALLSFMLVQGFSNEHLGLLPSSDAEFLAWADAPYVNNRNLRRHWPPGSVDVKSDGSTNAPPWDWNPMGCPGGNGCNDDDWMNHAPWPSSTVWAPAAGAPPPRTPATPGVPPAGVPSAPVGPPGVAGGGIELPGIGPVSPLVLGVAAFALVMLLRRR